VFVGGKQVIAEGVHADGAAIRRRYAATMNRLWS
jgi:hypothetical protein